MLPRPALARPTDPGRRVHWSTRCARRWPTTTTVSAAPYAYPPPPRRAPSRTAISTAPGLRIEVVGAPEPDPREPRRASAQRLWHYADDVPTPALPAPSATAVERIGQVAHPAWAHPPAAYDAAVGLAGLDLDDLLGLLVHPPAAPANAVGRLLAAHDPSVWVRGVQVWACLGLLHHRTDEPWEGSTRRRVLLDLIWGVEDWVTEAALFALVTAAWVDPSVRSDVARVVAERLADAAAVARSRPVPIAASLAHLALAAPAVGPGDGGTGHRTARPPHSPRLPRPRNPLRRLWQRCCTH